MVFDGLGTHRNSPRPLFRLARLGSEDAFGLGSMPVAPVPEARKPWAGGVGAATQKPSKWPGFIGKGCLLLRSYEAFLGLGLGLSYEAFFEEFDSTFCRMGYTCWVFDSRATTILGVGSQDPWFSTMVFQNQDPVSLGFWRFSRIPLENGGFP